MHPYYQKSAPRLKKEMDRYLSFIRRELEEELHRPYEELLEEVWQCYETDMLEYFPYIGGDKASGTANLTGAFSFVALGVVCRRYGMALERWGHLITILYSRFFAHFPKFLRRAVGLLAGRPGLAKALLRKKDAKNAANAAENPGSFETEVQEDPGRFSVIYHNKVCPLSNFAKERGYGDYMPYICNLDYVMFYHFGVHFERTGTCFHGDSCCNFCIGGPGGLTPYWPCHATDPRDPLL